MKKQHFSTLNLIGIALPKKTTNQNQQSNKDCGELWQRFEREEIYAQIPEKQTQEVIAVYHDYEGNHEQAFAYFIGCEVLADATPPKGLTKLTIPAGTYVQKIAKGQMPNCIATAWQNIWQDKSLTRAYHYDFEVYGEKSADWNNAEVPIYVSVKP